MEGKVVIRTTILMIMANLIFAVNNNPVNSIKEASYSECYVKCTTIEHHCYTDPPNYRCIVNCQQACIASEPNSKNQRLSSLMSFCLVGCSVTKCSEITESDQLKSCMADCSDIYCKI
ncbi:hypothetical protein ABFX02_09G054700 [Erythranthe guttata]